MMYEHVMLDLETLGTETNAVFISIGACSFSLEKGKLGDSFEINVDWQDSLKAGRSVTADTIKWWMRQSNEAQNKVCAQGVSLKQALKKFWSYFTQKDVPRFIWGNGATFDVTILQNAYEQVLGPEKTPWVFYNVFDLRTWLYGTSIRKDSVVRKGIEHDALSDAKHQAKMAILAHRERNNI